MKCYIVWRLGYECDELVNIYETEKNAQNFIIKEQGFLTAYNTNYVIEEKEIEK